MPAESTRALATLGLPWQIARWSRVVPGRIGGAALLAPVILFFLPLADFGLFESWRQGSVAVASLGALALAIGIGRDTAVPQPTEFWVYQKGLSLADWGLTRWILDAAFALAVFAAWLLAWHFAAGLAGEVSSFRVILALLTWLLAVHVILTALLFLLGALGSTRGSEIAVLFVLLAMLQPLITRVVPDGVAIAVKALLPPLLAAVNVRVGIGAGDAMRSMLPAVLHVGAYVGVLLAAGSLLLARRLPEHES